MSIPNPFPVSQFQHPRLTVPPPLMMSEPNSFAHLTLTQRWTAIARRVVSDNNFPTNITVRLETLVQELFNGVVRSLKDDGPDLAAWESYLKPYLGKPWLDVPWFFAEVYFYRRLLEATEYFQLGPQQKFDPFASQKQAGLETAMDDIRTMSSQTNTYDAPTEENIEQRQIRFASLLYGALWGNRADLSLQPTITAALTQSNVRSVEQSHILVDDTAVLIKHLSTEQTRIDLIADNAGFELVYDLYLIDFLLSHRITDTVHLHLKAHPTFVSDATILDVHQTLATLARDPDSAVRTWAERVISYVNSGRLKLCAAPCWTYPLTFWEMPQLLHQELAQANLVFIKGDANYRRLLGDCHWSFTTPFSDVVCYFPISFVVLRTLKSEIVVGLEQHQIETVCSKDPHWLTNGQWGVIQYKGYSS